MVAVTNPQGACEGKKIFQELRCLTADFLHLKKKYISRRELNFLTKSHMTLDTEKDFHRVILSHTPDINVCLSFEFISVSTILKEPHTAYKGFQSGIR